MRKISIGALLLIMAASVTAQNNRFGISAGFDVAHMVASSGGVTIHTQSRMGIVLGVNYTVPVGQLFSVQPALNFVQKGYKYKETDINYVYTDEMRVNYLEVPVNLIIKPRLQNVQLFFGAGPSVAFAISGKEKENDNGTIDEWDLSFGNDEDNDDLKGVDFGFNLLTGVELKNGLNFTVNYNLGLTDLVPGNFDGSIRNNYFGFKLGYTFSGKKK